MRSNAIREVKLNILWATKHLLVPCFFKTLWKISPLCLYTEHPSSS